MRQFLALAKKETAGILLSPPLLFAAAFFVLLDSVAFALAVTRPAPLALFDETALFMLFTSIVMFPLASMHAFAEDNAEGTLETLLTAPVPRLSVVLAKYAGGMAFALLYLLHGIAYAALLGWGGRTDRGSAAAAFLALLAVGSLATSLGVFVSAMTASPAAAAAGTGGTLIFLALLAEIDPAAGGAAKLLHAASFIPHAKDGIAGLLGTGSAVYFVSWTLLFLYWAWLAVGARQEEMRRGGAGTGKSGAAAFACAVAGVLLLAAQGAALHIGGFLEASGDAGTARRVAEAPPALFLPAALAAAAFLGAALIRRAGRRAARRRETDERDGDPAAHPPPASGARRRVLVCGVAALAIVLNLNWLARAPFRALADAGAPAALALLRERIADVTEDGRNSLSPLMLRALGGLSGRLRAHVFLPENRDVRGVPVAGETRRLFAAIARHSPLVAAVFVDADQEPERAKRLAGELGLPADTENPGELLVLDYQGRRAVLPAAALAADPGWERQAATGSARPVYDGENRLAGEIRRLADPRRPGLYLTYGHQELTPEAGAYPERSMSRLVRRLAGANWRVRQHAIARSGPLPPDCDVLVVAAPRTPFLPEEAEEVRRHLDRGGRLLAFAPVAGPDLSAAADPLNSLLAGIGGGVRDDVIEDALHNDNGQALAPLGKTRHPPPGGDRPMVFTLGRSVRDNTYAAENGWTVERMIETHPGAVATAVPSGEKTEGPFTLVYRAAKETAGGEARVVLFAAGRAAADSDSGRGVNTGLVLGLLQWLGGREEEDAPPPRVLIDRTLSFGGGELRAVLWIALAALPLAWAAAGMLVWRARRE